mgnify:CR=1 FL=1
MGDEGGFEHLVETRIREAMAAGAFRGLRGEGKPLPPRPYEWAAGERWLAFHLLEINGLLPEWLELAKEIEEDQAELRRLEAEHSRLCRIAATSGESRRYFPAVRRCREQYETVARRMRARQERFNLQAPGPATERPAIWLEYHLARLVARERESFGESIEA